jgi:ADP-ribose diphosphatase
VCTKSRLFTVETIGLRFSNGTEVEWERLTGSKRGAVLIVPMLDAETVLLIREYAAGVERYELALPKGKIDDGESIIDAANREMMEEIGYGAKHLRHIDSVTVAPGYLSHTTHIVLCSELYPKKLEGDEPEEIEVVPWKLNKLNELIVRDDVTEARTIAALYMVRDIMRGDV